MFLSKSFNVKMSNPYVPTNLIILLGCAGTGRATQLERLCERFHYVPIIPGVLVNEAKLNPASPHHCLISTCLRENTPVPGFIICDLIISFIEGTSYRKLMLDDFPHCQDHLVSFLQMIAPRFDVLKVVSLHCPSAICVQRIVGERSAPDDPSKVDLEKKLSCYWKNLEPVLEYCKGRDVLWQVDAVRSSEDVFEELNAGFANFA